MLITTFKKLPELNLHDREVHILCREDETIPVKVMAEEVNAKNLDIKYLFADSVFAAGIQIGRIAKEDVDVICEDIAEETIQIDGITIRIRNASDDIPKKRRGRPFKAKKEAAEAIEKEPENVEVPDLFMNPPTSDEKERQDMFQQKIEDYGENIAAEWAKLYVCVQDAKTEN